MIYLELLVISLIIVWIDDLTDLWDTFKGWIGKRLNCKVGRLKPFDCSLCGTWWIGLIWLLAMGEMTLFNVGYVALLAYLTPVSLNLLQLIRDSLNTFLNWLYKTLIN